MYAGSYSARRSAVLKVSFAKTAVTRLMWQSFQITVAGFVYYTFTTTVTTTTQERNVSCEMICRYTIYHLSFFASCGLSLAAFSSRAIWSSNFSCSLSNAFAWAFIIETSFSAASARV